MMRMHVHASRVPSLSAAWIESYFLALVIWLFSLLIVILVCHICHMRCPKSSYLKWLVWFRWLALSYVSFLFGCYKPCVFVFDHWYCVWASSFIIIFFFWFVFEMFTSLHLVVPFPIVAHLHNWFLFENPLHLSSAQKRVKEYIEINIAVEKRPLQ